MRINLYLAQSLGCSRRAADSMIEQGQVQVNGRRAKLGQDIDLKKDKVLADGKAVEKRQETAVTIALYKPKGYLSVRSDPRGRKTVMDLLPKELQYLKPVGRLDYDSEGLLLLSSDGKFILKSTHPKYEKQKEYRLVFKKAVPDRLLTRFGKGIRLPEGLAKADRVERIDRNEIAVVIHQGWNRQLRRMAETCGAEVAKLICVRSGDIELEDLKPGEWRKVKGL
jgi:23S rRNA pseudouridine2605 synthase